MLSRLISVDPQSFDLDYATAWSVWPSLVRVRNVKLRGNDANVQWQIEIDAAWVSVDLLALFGRQFHATRVRAEGISFRLRQKLEADAATTDRIAPLPPIVGFDGRPLRGDLPPIDQSAKVPYDLWSVHIENVDGIARQVWIDEVRFEGKARVSGAFFLKPKRLLWVGPAHADIFSGTVTLGDAKLLAQISGTADCRIPPFDPSLPFGIEYYRYISGAVRLDADVPDVRALDYYPRIRGIPLSFGGGNGGLHFDGTLRDGIVRPMNLSLTLRDLAAKTGSWLIGASIEASARAGSTGPSVWTARLSPLALERAGATFVVIGEQPLQVGTLVDEIDLSRAA